MNWLPVHRRVVIVGNSGSGKSTLAREVGARLGLPVVPLDAVFWQPGWVEPACRRLQLSQRRRVSTHRTMIYETLLIIGALGMLAQAALGLGHGFGGHTGHHSGPGHAGHGHGQHGGGHERGEQAHGPSPLWALLSPLAIFSLCVGAGATGLLAHALLHGSWLALAALLGAAVFYGLLVRPVWNFAMRFASEPARALEGVVAANAEAMGRFDAQGRGMVRVILDGQVVRLLAHLEPEERQSGVPVASGDRLMVTSVDGKTNTCRVTRL